MLAVLKITQSLHKVWFRFMGSCANLSRFSVWDECFPFLPLRIEQYYEAILALWNQLYINMKSLVSWHYCMIDIEKIRAMTIAKVCLQGCLKGHVVQGTYSLDRRRFCFPSPEALSLSQDWSVHCCTERDGTRG